MRPPKLLALLLALLLLAGVTAQAAEDAAGPSPEPTEQAQSDAADAPPPPTGGQACDGIVMGRDWGRAVLENCVAGRQGSVLIRTVFAADDTAGRSRTGHSGGYEALFKNTSGVGDVLHEDFAYPFVLTLESARLTGSVAGLTRGAWEAANGPLEHGGHTGGTAEETDPDDGKPSLGEEAGGVRMTMDGDSVWTVTGDSQLYSFSLADGAEVRAGEGQSLAIYVDCAMDEAAACYDAGTGSRIRAFVPGVEYTGVVIRPVAGESPEQGDLFAALGIGTAVVDGEYSVSVVELLEALGVEVTVDETTGDILVNDPDGRLEALLDGTGQ